MQQPSRRMALLAMGDFMATYKSNNVEDVATLQFACDIGDHAERLRLPIHSLLMKGGESQGWIWIEARRKTEALNGVGSCKECPRKSRTLECM